MDDHRLDALIADAVSAARIRANAGVDDGAATRLKLRDSLAARRSPRRRRLATIIAAVIAMLFGSTAFAFIAGWRPLASDDPPPAPPTSPPSSSPAAAANPRASRRAIETVASAEQPIAVVEAPVVDVPRAAPAVSAPSPAATTPPDAAPARVPLHETVSRAKSATSTRSPSPPATSTIATTPSPATSSPPAPSPATSPSGPRVGPSGRDVERPSVRAPAPSNAGELAAYRVAHEAHFRGNDPVAALAAWDAYLARYPNGQLAPEARYDRALVLVKLKRYGEARVALAPFANAPAGSYRQRDAAKLLAALPAR